jgi:hypothetical protein
MHFGFKVFKAIYIALQTFLHFTIFSLISDQDQPDIWASHQWFLLLGQEVDRSGLYIHI